jgi:hypothetical protein
MRHLRSYMRVPRRHPTHWLLLASLIAALSTVAAQESNPPSLTTDAFRARAEQQRGFRLIISLAERRLYAMYDQDTLRNASVAVASEAELSHQGRRWRFTTPRGRRVVVRKDSLPVWVPPEWHYYEVARERGLIVRQLTAAQPAQLDDGTRLEVRGPLVGIVELDSTFTSLPPGDEIIFDGFLFVPPLGTRNRQIEGELGRYRLDLGEGFALHGTPHQDSIGQAATHGCIRLLDEDIAWLYHFVAIGTPVYIY